MRVVCREEIRGDQEGMEVGGERVDLLKEELEGGESVVWNGGMGVLELSKFGKGRMGVCEGIGELKDGNRMMGGGECGGGGM
ncbi:phosphoglycerate kinase [Staphylococcus auricularis]|uniref:phosphoglycerate kinase n=1 Tax=Staphylococcus auricularis TaxID=29379 RepID=UPI001244FA2A